MKWPLEILGDIGISSVVHLIIDKFKEKGAEEVTKIIMKKVTDERRAEVLVFIQQLDGHGDEGEKAKKNLMGWHSKRLELAEKPDGGKYKPGDENDFATLLAKLCMIFTKEEGGVTTLGEKEKKELVKIFIQLGQMDEKKFNAALEFLNHDVIKQWVRRFWGYGKDAIAQIDLEVKEHEKEIVAKIKKSGEKGAKALNSLDCWLEKKLPKKDPSIFRGVMGGITTIFRRKGAKNG